MSKNWKLDGRDGIGVLELNVPNTEVNVLSTEGLTELKEMLTQLKSRKDLKALLITSAKKRIFIAGADINEIQTISTKEDAFNKAEEGKAVFQILEDLPYPTITVINGACLGGGYELALSTDYRVASFSNNVKIGLPEVNLGILPGFGGSIRMPKKLGLLKSLPLILAGKICSAKDALRHGMIDKLFPDRTLRDNAVDYARSIIAGEVKPKKNKCSIINQLLENTPFGRSFVLKQAKKNVLKKTKGFYPAPLKVIDLIEKTYGKEPVAAFRQESTDFSDLATTEISKNCIKLFFMSEKYKKHRWTQTETKPSPIHKCGIIGAGVMGGGIAQRVSDRGIPVRVKDINDKALGGALAEASKIYTGAVKRRKMKKSDMDTKMGHISVGLTNDGLKSCDVIIEAVVESMKIKQQVFKELDSFTSPKTILASNTSSLSVSEMASVTQHPERVVGLHFFNPVHRMPLVEVIRGKQTSDDTLEQTIAFSRKLGKTVIVTEDAPGFLVNRLLMPYLNEAATMIDEGMSPDYIDKIATDFGMPMGPLELIDQVGIDVGFKVAQILEDAFGSRMKMSQCFHSVYDKGLLGKKSGQGFYLYDNQKKQVNPAVGASGQNKTSEQDVLKRLIYIMINEAARCLEEKVIDQPSTVDIGMVMGTGFPPFRAGLLHYADSVGIKNIIEDLKLFQDSVSAARFTPSAYLTSLSSFY